MQILGREKLLAFSARHRDAGPWVGAWVAEVETGMWRKPHDVKARYGSADILGQGRVVFDICGNRYRLVVKIRYQDPGIVDVRFVGTHAEYTKIDARTV